MIEEQKKIAISLSITALRKLDICRAITGESRPKFIERMIHKYASEFDESIKNISSLNINNIEDIQTIKNILDSNNILHDNNSNINNNILDNDNNINNNSSNNTNNIQDIILKSIQKGESNT